MNLTFPFSRQQLADYLGVERSGLSLNLGKMRGEGSLTFIKVICSESVMPKMQRGLSR